MLVSMRRAPVFAQSNTEDHPTHRPPSTCVVLAAQLTSLRCVRSASFGRWTLETSDPLTVVVRTDAPARTAPHRRGQRWNEGSTRPRSSGRRSSSGRCCRITRPSPCSGTATSRGRRDRSTRVGRNVAVNERVGAPNREGGEAKVNTGEAE